VTLERVLGDLLGTRAASFQAFGEDLTLLPGARLAELADDYRRALGAVPDRLRARFEAEQAAAQAEAHRWLRRYNRSLFRRIQGYIALGERSGWDYPWPVVAVLGLCQVIAGLRKNRWYGALGVAMARMRGPLGRMEEIIDLSDDVLRRTNRGIFADSVPTVLYALHAREVAAQEPALGAALLDGPLPPLMDDEARALARGLVDGLALADPGARFAALAALTLRHFDREQAIFTHQLGPPRPQRPPAGRAAALLGRVFTVTSVPAPAVVGGRLIFRDHALPPGFDMHDHAARVREFGRAFVTSVTGSRADYAVARDWVRGRFPRPSRG